MGVEDLAEEGNVFSMSGSGRLNLLGGLNCTFGVQIFHFHMKNDQTIVFIFPEGGQPRNVQPFSDEDASIETMSHCSGFSDPASFTEDGIFFHFYLIIFLKT